MKTKAILTALSLATSLTIGVRADQAQVAASMKDVRVEAGQTHDQLTSTLAALTALTKQEKGDLKPAYKTFCAEIPKTEAAAAATRARVAWLEHDGVKYFEDWQKTINSISNESLRKNAQKRFDTAKKSYVKVIASLRDAAEKFKPFLANLVDIQKVLANDVTANGVKAIRSTVNDANWRYKSVNRTVDDALDELKKMEKSLSTQAK